MDGGLDPAVAATRPRPPGRGSARRASRAAESSPRCARWVARSARECCLGAVVAPQSCIMKERRPIAPEEGLEPSTERGCERTATASYWSRAASAARRCGPCKSEDCVC